MDAHPWEQREKRFGAKFAAGRKHIPSLFSAFSDLPDIEQVALLVFAGNTEGHPTVGGGRVLLIRDLMADIRAELAGRCIASRAVPEQYVILRCLQFASNYWKSLP
jgi:hypothetical protein